STQINNDQKNNIIIALQNSFNKVDELRFETVDPTIGSDVVRKAILALILAVFGILMYVAYAFRRVPGQVSSWRFGGAAIVALVHDVLILLGIYAIVSRFWGAEIDSMFITALLTLLGFSVHDTIVTFDRVRENLRRRVGEDLAIILNDSIVQTIVRSINTSFTLFLVLVAMFFFGGPTIKFFTLAMIIGVVVGTYSSIFIASPLLLIGYKKS
ncbi:MAG: protein translocase subunit SecF, partial [Patescibacteria group bacterium]